MLGENISDNYYNKGLIHFRNDDLTTAKELLNKAIHLNPTKSGYYNLQGLCLYQLGEFNKAKVLWEQSIVLKGGDNNLARRYLNLLAEKEFQDSCQQYNEAYHYALNKEFKKATNLMSKNKLLDHNIVKMNNFYGLCYYAQGNKHKALLIWQGVLKNDVQNPQSLKYLSQIDMGVKGIDGIFGRFKHYLKTIYKGGSYNGHIL